MIRAVRFFEEIRRGSSLPVLVGGDDGNKYVVKLNGAGDGVLANAVEFVTSKLAGLLEIPVLPTVLLELDERFGENARDQETVELVAKSAGINLGTLYLDGALVFTEQNARGLDDSLKRRIFFFDLFVLDVDRSHKNPNMLWHRETFWSLDYSSAMDIRSAITGTAFKEHVLLKQLKRHPFYNDHLSPYAFIKKLASVPDRSILEIVEALPESWLSALRLEKNLDVTKAMIAERLLRKKSSGMALRDRLDLLRVLKLETEAELESRALENKRAFEMKYGKL